MAFLLCVIGSIKGNFQENKPGRNENSRMASPEEYRMDQNLGIHASVSECKTYAPDERLAWTFNPREKVVQFLHSSMEMNCCGKLVVTILFEDGRYVLHEQDDVEDKEYGRCGCICYYDMKIELPCIEGKSLRMAVVQHLIDSGLPEAIVWEGEFDLQRGSGDIFFTGKLIEYPSDEKD